tara:strand:+ start:193 stop:744 length:552 start_codon:yes stop_codon:yes gene_type:complete
MYVIEDETHTLILDGRGRELVNRLSAVHRPDGGMTTNAKVDEPLPDEQGRSLTIRTLTEPIEEIDGGGPRSLGNGPVEYVGGAWRRTRKFGPALPPTPKKIVTFEEFESKFTTQEWDAATDYVYEMNTTTGKPKRRMLMQGLARAQAHNTVDLLDNKTDAFLSLLVSGGVITAERKTEILTPV